jgi:hypothetical protein
MKVFIVLYHDSIGNMNIEEIFSTEDKAEEYIKENDSEYTGYYELVERKVL